MSEHIEITEADLAEVPIFPLPGTVLLPRTVVSLHVFEPRYREMTRRCLETNRLMIIGMLAPERPPDSHGRPAIHATAGLGLLRHSARLPDGRYNIALEGILRVSMTELEPRSPYRRASVRILEDQTPEDPRGLDRAAASLRSLCSRAIPTANTEGSADLEGLHTVEDPGLLADLAAAAALTEPAERQQVLEELDVEARVQLVAGALGALMIAQSLESKSDDSSNPGWGIQLGKA